MSAAATAKKGNEIPVCPSTVKQIDDRYKTVKQLLAGGGAGATTKTCIAPLERIKILQQIQGMHGGSVKYRGILQSGLTVIREEGFLALYKGNGTNVLRIIPNYALKFSFNDTFKEAARRKGQKEELSFYQLMLAGSMAGLLQITTTYPMELIRTRLSLNDSMKQGERYTGIFDCLRKTVKAEGFFALYKGIVPTWWSGTPYVGLQMTFYAMSKDKISKLVAKDGEKTSSAQKVGISLVSGALSGIMAQTITYPGDTVRRRMQTNGIGGSPRIYTTTWDCCKKIVQNEGAGAFFKGIRANTIRCIPGAGIQFLAYDSLKMLLGVSDK